MFSANTELPNLLRIITRLNGKLNFEIDLGILSEIFEKTDAQKDFAFHFHRERAERTDMIKWNESSYKYTFDGKTVKIEK